MYSSRLDELIRSGRYHCGVDGIVRPDLRTQSLDTPWVHYGRVGNRRCQIWQEIHFGVFRHIPTYCQERCWKVVVEPQQVTKLFEIDRLFSSTKGLTAKCGIDRRAYTFGLYKAFIYCESLPEARERKAWLESRKIPASGPKRGCTEFENHLPSEKWSIDRNQEALLNSLVDTSMWPDFKQPSWLVDRIKVGWVQAAYSTGDPTYIDTPFADMITMSREPATY